MSDDWQAHVALDGQGPVYEQIKRTLTENIRSGRWAAGHRLPPETTLAGHLEASRMTVHRALREMTEDGLLVRRRRAGTFVADPPSPTALLRIVDMARAIPRAGRRYGYRCLLEEVTDADDGVADRLGIDPGDPVRHVVCLHEADGEPLELEERWINLAVLPEAGTADFRDRGPGGWLLEAAPWTEAEHTVTAINADSPLAERLGIRENAACLVLERRTFQGDRVVTFARLTHPGERHRLAGRFSPTS